MKITRWTIHPRWWFSRRISGCHQQSYHVVFFFPKAALLQSKKGARSATGSRKSSHLSGHFAQKSVWWSWSEILTHQNTPWKINRWNLQITHLERKMISTKPPWLWSMLIFQGVTDFDTSVSYFHVFGVANSIFEKKSSMIFGYSC